MEDKNKEKILDQNEPENDNEESGLNSVLEMINAKGNARKLEDAVKDGKNEE
ncbi:hypothetical protein [Fictibacillus fluitans]|uniref:Uncharacterized protein n=1 Tax=Fictibacillus fluitans TaxID=3058422 RepID=A0ABT8I3D2_9BACL|nr:hypothetical protein [Fictibacillus sp. NE201]MDN4527550.1 hypothetical protein [Fictibacillus sp. NE201]